MKFKKGTIERAAKSRGLHLGQSPNKAGLKADHLSSVREAISRKQGMRDAAPGNQMAGTPMPGNSLATSDKLRTLAAIRNSSRG